MTIGLHEFPHHIFVSKMESISSNCDIILGQPFLHWYTARIDYARSGEVQLILWKLGDKDQHYAPTISIIIAAPEDPRNQTEIKTSHAHPTTRIEEVEDIEGSSF